MKPPTAAEKRRFSAVVALGCAVSVMHLCSSRKTIHHCFTGAGGRKVHKDTICLCWNMHLGRDGIDGQRLSKRQWQAIYGSEAVLLAETERRLTEGGFYNG